MENRNPLERPSEQPSIDRGFNRTKIIISNVWGAFEKNNNNVDLGRSPEQLPYFMLRRAAYTMDSIDFLRNRGINVDAWVLARHIFELDIEVGYIFNVKRSVKEIEDLCARYVYYLLAEWPREVSLWGGAPKPESKRARKEALKRFPGLKKCKAWTNKTISARASSAGAYEKFIYSNPYHHSCRYTHTGPGSLGVSAADCGFFVDQSVRSILIKLGKHLRGKWMSNRFIQEAVPFFEKEEWCTFCSEN